jgi:hypothetical protein
LLAQLLARLVKVVLQTCVLNVKKTAPIHQNALATKVFMKKKRNVNHVAISASLVYLQQNA